MPQAKAFLKKTFPDRGGYTRHADKEKVEILWKRGEDPRLELLEKQDNKLVKRISLKGLSQAQIEKLLTNEGFEPVKPAAGR